ncbi:acyltransferase family protein [uncultured Legionella sp.]|uniref:acyltransferase family protein n=1 Tax=uncultured Legionella sp. TaxID=210934 RepID=UPI00261641D2|nr:acyltransferase family protein [uncultured Legionella sp.]
MMYRPDIDGLRAIAILLVLIYHGGLSLFPSGFIGVDVFFVISGFLITKIINESLNNQHFSFLDFYNRRLWRLQPVFVCLLLVTTVFSLLLFLPDDLIQFSRSARKTSLFVSNLFFNKTTTGYFAPETQLLPLLHTWSLSIEWQCYLLLPLVMFCLHRLFSKRNVLLAVGILTLFSFIMSLHSSNELPIHTYYQFSSRLFEFLIGGCIALIPVNKPVLHPYVATVAGAASLIAIIYIGSLKHLLPGYPDWYALTVCMATGILIALGSFYPRHFLVRWLSFKPLVGIGILSYSLYIWHWAVFSFLRYQNSTETTGLLLLAYGITAVLGYFSWRYIETPARRYKNVQFRYTLVILLVLPFVLTHLSSAVFKFYSGFPQRFEPELTRVYQQLNQYENQQRPLCIGNNKADSSDLCTLGATESPAKSGFMIGDSFSNHYWGFMDILGKSAGVSIQMEGTSFCLTLPGLYLYDWWYFKDKTYQECYRQTQKYFSKIQQNRYDYVIIGQIWGDYLTDSIINSIGDERSVSLAKYRFREALERALKIITESGANPVLIKSTALTKHNARECVFKHFKLHQSYVADECNFRLQLSEQEHWIYSLFEELALKYPQLIVIDPTLVQCPEQLCNVEFNGVPIYRDAVHITDFASYQLGTLYLQQFGNPLT